MILAGRRQVEGEALVLLKRGGADDVVVLPVDAATARRLRRIAVGEPLTVTPRGAIRTSKVQRSKVQTSKGRRR